MSSSDLSSLSSAQSLDTDEELAPQSNRGSLDHYFQNGASKTTASPLPKKKRAASPPHEYVLADNPDIAFIVMFRSRFAAAFPKSLPHYGPQDIERGIGEELPDEEVEKLLCALIGLVLNRRKDVERGHFAKALEETVQSNASQWPAVWEGKNPLRGGVTFANMTPVQRLTLLKTLVLWALGSSEAIQGIIKESYKQQRHEDDLNQPLSVHPWGRDGDKRRYWLIEGQDDTPFRLYRESNPTLKHNTWWSVANSIDGLKDIAAYLEAEGSQAAKRLRDCILNGIPRFEASDEKQKRRDYRLARKSQFTRTDPGFSLYEGRTRGKRVKYAYSDEDEDSDSISLRRSSRKSGISTPAEPAGPTFTASGRQVRSRIGGTYGETMTRGTHFQAGEEFNGAGDDYGNDEVEPTVPRNSSNVNGGPLRGRSRPRKAHIDGYNSLDELEDETEASSSGNDWDADDDDEPDDPRAGDDDGDDDDIDMTASEISGDDQDHRKTGKGSLVVSLRYQKAKQGKSIPSTNGNALADTKEDDRASSPPRHQFKVHPTSQSPIPEPEPEASGTINLETSEPRRAMEDLPVVPAISIS